MTARTAVASWVRPGSSIGMWPALSSGACCLSVASRSKKGMLTGGGVHRSAAGMDHEHRTQGELLGLDGRGRGKVAAQQPQPNTGPTTERIGRNHGVQACIIGHRAHLGQQLDRHPNPIEGPQQPQQWLRDPAQRGESGGGAPHVRSPRLQQAGHDEPGRTGPGNRRVAHHSAQTRPEHHDRPARLAHARWPGCSSTLLDRGWCRSRGPVATASGWPVRPKPPPSQWSRPSNPAACLRGACPRQGPTRRMRRPRRRRGDRPWAPRGIGWCSPVARRGRSLLARTGPVSGPDRSAAWPVVRAS